VTQTLTDELARVTVADVEKWEDGPDGTLYVYGRCTTPEIDTDDQIVDSSWSGSALKQWLDTAPTVRVQHNAMRDPAGSGVKVDVNRDGDGAHWLKAAVDEPVAQKLVKKGHLRAFSVGIARPVIERDVAGKARGGIIRGGTVVEVSLVDSPANRSCFLELAKADKDGVAEFTGKVFADDDTIQKALDGDLTKAAAGDFVNVDLPRGASISISPADIAKLHTFKQQLTVKSAATIDTEKRDVSAAERRRLASEGHALPDGSYPIDSTEDLHNAAILAASGHGDAADAKRLVAREARERGVANPLDSDAKKAADGEPKETVEKADAPAEETVAPDVTKEPADKPVKKAGKKPKGKKKLPPWLNKPDDSSSDDGACKGAHAWVHVGDASPVPDIRCEKCHTTPAEAAGLSGTHDMQAAPVPELLESPPVASTKGSPTPASASGARAESMTPVPAHREPDGAIVEPFEKDAQLPATGQGETPTRLEAGMMKSSPEVAAILRFKAAGIDAELGRLHDLTCPAYHPEDVQRFHPFADFATLTDTGLWQRKALEAACGPVELALKMHELHQSALAMKAADPADLNQWRLDAHKAFRDANPGPSTYPSPGMVSPQKYNRPLLTDGRAATSTGHDGPNTSPQVATMAPDAHSFDRPPLAAGHQSPSPSHMKSGFPYPGAGDGPVQLNYAVTEKERARQALMQMHEHLGRQFPEACPIDLDRPAAQPESRGVPVAVGKSAIPDGVTINIASTDGKPVQAEALTAQIRQSLLAAKARNDAAAATKAPAGDLGEFADDAVYKGFKKARKKMGKKVLSGKMTVDEARSRLGRQFAQKAADPDAEYRAQAVALGVMTPDEAEKAATAQMIKSAVAEALASTAVQGEAVTLEAANYGTDPEVIKAAVTEATTELKELLVKQTATFTEKLADQQRVIDAIADQPDPSTAAFSGLAFNPVQKSRRPAGVLTQAEAAERSQQMMIRHLSDTVNSASDPYEREAAYATLTRLRGGDA